MATVESSMSVSGTVLHREGMTPLLAVAVTVGDRLTQASLIDPSDDPVALEQALRADCEC